MALGTCLAARTVTRFVLGSNALLLLVLAVVFLIWRKRSVKKDHDEEETKHTPPTPHDSRQDSLQSEDAVTSGGGVAGYDLYRRISGPLREPIGARVCPWSPYDVGNIDVSDARNRSSQQGIYRTQGGSETSLIHRADQRSVFTDATVGRNSILHDPSSIAHGAAIAFELMGTGSGLEDSLRTGPTVGPIPTTVHWIGVSQYLR
jgi:Ca2+/Na+ antiporter